MEILFTRGLSVKKMIGCARLVLVAAILICTTTWGIECACARSCNVVQHIVSCRRFNMPDIRDCVHGHRDVSVLDVSFTHLERLANDTFRGLKAIRHINMDSVSIGAVESGTLKVLPLLETMSARHIGHDVFKLMPAFEKASYLIEVNLGGNFHTCSCKWWRLWKALSMQGIQVMDSTDIPLCTEQDAEHCDFKRDTIGKRMRDSAVTVMMHLLHLNSVGALAAVLVALCVVIICFLLCCTRLLIFLRHNHGKRDSLLNLYQEPDYPSTAYPSDQAAMSQYNEHPMSGAARPMTSSPLAERYDKNVQFMDRAVKIDQVIPEAAEYEIMDASQLHDSITNLRHSLGIPDSDVESEGHGPDSPRSY